MWCVSLETPIHFKIGLDIIAAVEPVIANTNIMTKICQLLERFQRCLRFPMFLKVLQIYLIYEQKKIIGS